MKIVQTLIAGIDFEPMFLSTPGREERFKEYVMKNTRKKLRLNPTDEVEIILLKNLSN